MEFFNLFSILSILNYEAPTRQGYSAQAPKVLSLNCWTTHKSSSFILKPTNPKRQSRMKL